MRDHGYGEVVVGICVLRHSVVEVEVEVQVEFSIRGFFCSVSGKNNSRSLRVILDWRGVEDELVL